MYVLPEVVSSLSFYTDFEISIDFLPSTRQRFLCAAMEHLRTDCQYPWNRYVMFTVPVPYTLGKLYKWFPNRSCRSLVAPVVDLTISQKLIWTATLTRSIHRTREDISMLLRTESH